MGRSGDDIDLSHSQKWAFLNISDFRCTSSLTVLAYIWVWFLAIVSLVVYGLDTYTAISLLVWDRWSSAVQPALDFKYSKWIFAACILLSWSLLFYEWFRAIRVMRRDGVAETYMDPLACIAKSLWTPSMGWKRFLVYTELTKHRKGLDYTALFVYFASKTIIRVVLAEGPRIVVNAMTLWAVLQSKILGPAKGDHSAIVQFFLNLEALAQQNEQQAFVYGAMFFTLVIWVFSAITLLIAGLTYILFLMHQIPSEYRSLSVYCKCKIDKRLANIVAGKVKAALEEEERQKRKADRKLERIAESKRTKTADPSADLLPPPKLIRQPTLPQLGNSPETRTEEKLAEFSLARQNTGTTIATVSSQEKQMPSRTNEFAFQRQPTLPDLQQGRPGMPARSGTQISGWSNTSYASNAPLLNNAGYAGEPDQGLSRMPSAVSQQDSGHFSGDLPPPDRGQSLKGLRSQPSFSSTLSRNTGSSGRPILPLTSDGSYYSQVPPRIPLPVRSNTAFSYEQPMSAVSQGSPAHSFGPPTRQNTISTFSTVSGRQDRSASPFSPNGPPISRNQTLSSIRSQNSFNRPMTARQPSQTSLNRPYTPASVRSPLAGPADMYEMSSQPPRSNSTQPPSTGYVAFSPAPQAGPPRNVTLAGTPGTEDNYFGHVRERSATAPIHRQSLAYADILDDYGAAPWQNDREYINHTFPSGTMPAPPRPAATGGRSMDRQYRPYQG